jgi:hypothetical protein
MEKRLKFPDCSSWNRACKAPDEAASPVSGLSFQNTTPVNLL